VEDLLQLILKTYGVAGIIMLSPFAAVWILWKANEKLRTEIQSANDKVSAVQDKRVDDAKEVASKLLAMAKEHAALATETNAALDRVGDMMSMIQSRRP
jgi:hypothetical protein